MLSLNARLARVGADRRRLAVDNCRRPEEGANLGLLEKNADAACEARDDRILPGDGAGEIELRLPNRQPDCVERAGLPEAMGGARGMDQRFRRNAADVEAGSAEPVGFDENRVEAELASADRRDIAAGAAADDENLAAKLVHVLVPKPGSLLSPPRKRGSRRQFGEQLHVAPALLDTRFRGYANLVTLR